MRRLVFLLPLVAALLLPGMASAQFAYRFAGSWSSNRYGAGGAVQMHDVQVAPDGVITGQILFSGSPCGHWAPFNGRYFGETASIGMDLGPPCGFVQINLQRSGPGWVGIYQVPQIGDLGNFQIWP